MKTIKEILISILIVLGLIGLIYGSSKVMPLIPENTAIYIIYGVGFLWLVLIVYLLRNGDE